MTKKTELSILHHKRSGTDFEKLTIGEVFFCLGKLYAKNRIDEALCIHIGDQYGAYTRFTPKTAVVRALKIEVTVEAGQ